MKEVPELPAALLNMIRRGEDYQLEYKEAKTGLPKSLFDTVCSFSNREGGDIFLGVHDCGVIVGVDPGSAAKLITDFGNQAYNKDKLFPPTYLAAKEYLYRSEGGFSGTDKDGKTVTERPGEYHVLHIHVPASPVVVRHHGRIFDRNGDADIDITNISDIVFQYYARKQSTYYVNRVYPHWGAADLRPDLIGRARRMAAARRRRDSRGEAHPWEAWGTRSCCARAG